MRKRKAASSDVRRMWEGVGPNDVLFGRGTGVASHCGNVNFRCIVSEHKVSTYLRTFAECIVSYFYDCTILYLLRLVDLTEVGAAVFIICGCCSCPLHLRYRQSSTNSTFALWLHNVESLQRMPTQHETQHCVHSCESNPQP